MKKISIICAIIILVSITLTGCGGRKPDNVGIVHAIGIDKADDGFELSLQVFRVSSAGSQTPIDSSKTNVEIISAKGKTIANAVELCENQLGKEMFFGHNQLLVINKKVDDIYSCLNYFINNDDAYIGMIVAATEKSSKDIISADISSGTVAAETMKKIFDISKKDGYSIDSRFFKVVSDYIDTDGTMVLPLIEKRSQAIADKSKESGEPAQDSLEIKKAILVNNSKFSKVLDIDEVFGINYFLGGIEDADITVNTSYGTESVTLKSIKEKAEVSEKDDGVKIEKNITVGITLEKEESKEHRDEIKQEVEKKVTEYINKAVEKTLKQDLSDVLEITTLIRQRDYNLYKKLTADREEFLKKVSVSAKVNAVY